MSTGISLPRRKLAQIGSRPSLGWATLAAKRQASGGTCKMLNLKYDYISCINKSEQIAWRLDELFPTGTALQFNKAHMPDGLVAVGQLPLAAEEKLKLNQIRGNSYMN